MATYQEAWEFIEQRRRARNFNDEAELKGDANAESLSRALKMLSGELYKETTHFILEMIQNADDNAYAQGVEPTLTIVYRGDGNLWVGCNEIGFSKANVAAICEIADSTKKVTGAQKGYIGEKGIGFKSVFSVADRVWISSGNFTFRFDRDRLLGMIVPIWAEMPTCETFQDRTMFCLRIPESKHRAAVKAQMLKLKAELLLFLRKLRAIHVVIVGKNGKKVEHDFWIRRHDTTDGNACVKTSLSRHDTLPEEENQVEELIVFRHTTQSMPKEEKREGVEKSELVLAFPISSTSPPTNSRPTYNFLPIREYGFRFLLQADFILTANRGDIVEGNDWNRALKEAAFCLFLQSVKAFNKSGILKYDWPKFILPVTKVSGTIMDNFFGSLLQYLREEPVLQSWSGDLASPSSLSILPERYMDAAGRPLLSRAEHTVQYINTKYPIDGLSTLGVQEQTHAAFSKMLQRTDEQHIHNKDAVWHSNLAEAITSGPTKRFRTMKLVPLQDGTWQAGNRSGIFLPEGRVDVPPGIDIDVVHKNAAKGSRRKMFESWGIKKLDKTQVGQAILDFHEQLGPELEELALETLIAQVRWFYEVDYKSDLNGLKLVAQHSNRLTAGTQLYLDAKDASFSFSEHFSDSVLNHDFLHPEYHGKSNLSSRPSWPEWLQEKLGIWSVPHLYDSEGELHPDFEHLIASGKSSVWLKLLRDNWTLYFGTSRDIDPDTCGIGSAKVACTDGSVRMLDEVYLPNEEICNEPLAMKHVACVKVEDANDQSWLKLSLFGVGTSKDLPFYLAILRSLAASSESEPSTEDIGRIFRAIKKLAGDEEEEEAYLLEQLSSEALIPLRSGNLLSWHSLGNCRWKAPGCLRSITALDAHYPHLEKFFREVLHVQDAIAEDVIKELQDQSRSSGDVRYMRDLIFALNDLLQDIDEELVVPGLRELGQLEIFPVRFPSDQVRLMSLKDKSWFIADRPRLYSCFAEKVPLLDFRPEDVISLRRVLFETGLEKVFLSKRRREQTDPQGQKKHQLASSELLRSKQNSISYLAQPAERCAVLDKLSTLEVWTCESLVLRRYVRVDGTNVYGQDEVGRVVLNKEEQPIRLYLTASRLAADGLAGHFVAEELCSLIEDPRPDSEAALLSILTTTDPGEMKDILERKGLWEGNFVLDIPIAAREVPIDADGSETVQDRTRSGKSTATPDALHTKPSGRGARRKAGGAARKATAFKPKDVNAQTLSSLDPAAATDEPPSYQESEESQAVKQLTTAAEDYDMDEVVVLGMEKGSKGNYRTELLHGADVQVDKDTEEFQGNAELFVYKILQEHFQIENECWTGPSRTRIDLPALSDDNPNIATFTIDETAAAQRLSKWLLDRDFKKAADWMSGDTTYHIDVQATNGDMRDHFKMTNEHIVRAKQWHKKGEDVYMIFRVYDLQESPKFCVWIDPIGLMMGGKLKFGAMGGFAVKLV